MKDIYKHFHFHSRLLVVIFILIALVFVIKKSDNGIAQVAQPNPIEIGGWAWNEEVGWLSLNCNNDFDGDGLLENTCDSLSYPYKLEVSNSGAVVGCAWGGSSRNSEASTTVGYICFSDPGGTEAPTFGTRIITQTGWCESATTCTPGNHSECNNPGEEIWQCTAAGYCETECTTATEATDCRSGQTCTEIKGSNFLCSGNFLAAFSGDDLPICAQYLGSPIPSVVDLESYGNNEWRLYPIKQNLLDAGLSYPGEYDFDYDDPNLYWGDVSEGGPYYSYDNPIEGCFNCYQQNIGHCNYRTGWSCEEGDGLCESIGDFNDYCDSDDQCHYKENECTTDADCPDFSASEDYCLVTDIDYRCQNCLEYHYYDHYNATTSRADECSLSQAPCEYVDTTYPNGYKYKREIKLNDLQVSGSQNLLNFPAYVSLSGEYFLRNSSKGGEVESLNGYDIIFSTSSDGSTSLAHEVEYYDYRTGDLGAWVRIPVLSYNVDTSIYMFVGNSSISTSTEDKSTLWQNYAFVSHMFDTGATEVSESVSSTIVGTKKAYGEPVSTTSGAVVKYGQHFDGVDDYIDFGNTANINMPVSLQTWFYITSADTGKQPYNFITTDDESGGDVGFWLRVANQLEVGFGNTGGSTKYKSTNPTLNTSHKFFVGTMASTNYADMKLYVNGTEVTDVTTGGNSGLNTYAHSSSTLRVGSRNGSYTAGSLDEVRVAKVVLSSDWIKTEYNMKTAYGSFVTLGCRQRYSSSTNGDQACFCTGTSEYPDANCGAFTTIPDTCDYCVQAEQDELQKVVAGYECTGCIIEDLDNSCELNAFGTNKNRCDKCEYTYTNPGVMYDNKNNLIPATTTSACDPNQDDPGADDFCQRGSLCGWAINANNYLAPSVAYGLGWFQFSPRVSTTSKPYFQVEGGNIYSKGSIYSRYTPPLGKFNATYLIESGGNITNIVSSSTLSDIYEGELSNRPTLDFFELISVGSSQKYKSPLGVIDYTGLLTDISAGGFGFDGVNKFGSAIDRVPNMSSILSLPLEGKVYYMPGNGTLGPADSRVVQIGTNNSAGIIVVEGDLSINSNITYEDVPASITTSKLIPSLVWIVRGDVFIDPTVTEVAGSFIILGDGATCPDAGCGIFDSGSGTNQLVVNGSVMARQFELNRTYSTADEPSEKFVNTGRVQANPPPGLEDFIKISPRYSY